MILHRLFFLVVFLLLPFCIFAQENPLEKNEQDKIYTPDKNSIFNNNGSGSSGNNNNSESEIKNAIKFNPSLLLRSTAALFYKRKIGGSVTIIPGLGFSFNKDRILEIGSELDLSSQDENPVPLSTIMAEGTFIGPSIYTAMSIRFYTSDFYYDDDFQSTYFEMNFRYSPFTMKLPANDPNDYPYIQSDAYVHLRSLTYLLNFGYQFYTSGKIKTTHDFFMGMGVRTVSYNKFTTEQGSYVDQWGNSQQTTINVKSSRRANALLPAFVFGYVFGIGF